jgi:hypothetical protein
MPWSLPCRPSLLQKVILEELPCLAQRNAPSRFGAAHNNGAVQDRFLRIMAPVGRP